jgi:hypothetical protein
MKVRPGRIGILCAILLGSAVATTPLLAQDADELVVDGVGDGGPCHDDAPSADATAPTCSPADSATSSMMSRISI